VKDFSVTFLEGVTKCDGYSTCYHHITLMVSQTVFCPACFLCHGSGSPDKMFCVWHRRIRNTSLTRSCKFSKNDMLCSVWQWTLVIFVKKKHICISTVQRWLAQTCYKIMWPAWVLCWYIFFKINPVELLSVTAINEYLNMIVWYFDHLVLLLILKI
jgi:hypothetical protein